VHFLERKPIRLAGLKRADRASSSEHAVVKVGVSASSTISASLLPMASLACWRARRTSSSSTSRLI